MFTGTAFAVGMFFGASVGPAGADPGTHRVLEPTLHDGFPSSPSATDTGWYREDTRVGGGVTLTKNFGAPPGLGDGSLALTTNDQNSAKAQLITRHEIYGASLADVSNLGYSTWHSATGSTTFTDANASYQLRIDLDGQNLNDPNTTDQTNLVYEPYWNDVEGTSPQHPEGIQPDTWQDWDATGGDWWSSKQIGNADASDTPPCGTFHIEPGAGGPPFTRPSEVAANCPDAKVVAVGVNVGSFNPSYVVAVDGLHFNIGADNFAFDFGPGPK
jgi:hypothetical protein